jgi:soluble lytic murein transglycosylase-like protein
VRFTAFLLLAFAGGPTVSAKAPPAVREYAVQCAERYARVNRVPVELVEAVIDVESNWNPYAVSPKGAVGLMQLMPGTALTFGVHSRFRVEDNIKGGVAYLASLIQFFKGDLRLAIAAYVAGRDRILPHGLKFSSPEVYEYVSRVAQEYHRRRLETMMGGKQ